MGSEALDLNRKIVINDHLLDEARLKAREDDQSIVFSSLAEIPMNICPKGGTVRYDKDSSLPEHSVLVTILKSDGRHHYTLGIVRHVFADGTVEWSANS